MATILLGAVMLLAGRVWGESLIAAAAERALRNEGRVDSVEKRLEDHITVQTEVNRIMLSELRDIRDILQGRQNATTPRTPEPEA